MIFHIILHFSHKKKKEMQHKTKMVDRIDDGGKELQQTLDDCILTFVF